MILWVSGRGRRLTFSLAPGETAPPTGPNPQHRTSWAADSIPPKAENRDSGNEEG